MSGPTSRTLSVAGVVLAVPVVASGIASAHGGTAGAGVPVSLVVTGSALVGLASGLGTVYWRSCRVTDALTHRRFAAVLGAGLLVLGALFFVPVVAATPVVALCGLAVGIGAAWRVPHGHADALTVEHEAFRDAAFGAIALHRVFEGVVLTAGYLAGSTVGLVTALVVTLHAAGETAAVGGLYALAGRHRRAVAAVLVIQTGFVVAALTGAAVAVTVPPVLRYLVVTMAAGVLVYFGVHECRQCYVGYFAPA